MMPYALLEQSSNPKVIIIFIINNIGLIVGGGAPEIEMSYQL
jgi:hypothetical protein